MYVVSIWKMVWNQWFHSVKSKALDEHLINPDFFLRRLTWGHDVRFYFGKLEFRLWPT